MKTATLFNYSCSSPFILAQKKKREIKFAEEFGNDHPPFGGTKEEYLELFSSHYDIEQMDIASNSIEARKGRELFISLKKQDCLT